jgi:hypothetical protein
LWLQIDRIRYIPANLGHPQSIGDGRDASNLYFARGQLEEEENEESLQPSSGPHFHGEEIRSYYQFPMPGQKLSPGCLPAPLRCWLDPVPFQNVSGSYTCSLI